MATPYYVAKTGNDGNDGSSWVLAKLTIQAGIGVASSTDTVWVRAGTYVENITVGTGVTVESETGVPTDVIIDGNSAGRTVTMTATSWLIGCWVTNGLSLAEGGGIYNGNVSNCIVSNNVCNGNGAGGCQACVLIYNSEIYSNTVMVNGGSDRKGGGVNGCAGVYNCLIRDNYAPYRGGGANESILYNCTIINNTADTINSDNVDWCTLWNCIIWNGDDSSPLQPNTYNYSCSLYAGVGGGNITSDPLFISPVNFRLQASSPCIDAGFNYYWMTDTGDPRSKDLDDNPRIWNSIVDMGTYESEYFEYSSSSSSVSSSSMSSSSLSSLSSSEILTTSSTEILTTSSTSSFHSGKNAFPNITGTLLNGNISMDVKNIVTENSIDVQITLFSNKFAYADIEFWYRTDFGEQWMNNAYISNSTAKFINGNQLFRLPCSPTGYNNVVRWEYEKNQLTTGNNIQIKIKAIPSVSVFSNYGYYTMVENVYSGTYNEIESIVPYKIIGVDNYGNYMCFNNNQFIIVDKDKKIIMQYSGVKNVICCQQMFNDNYIILDNDDKKITEMSKDGILIYELQSAVLFSNPYYFTYDKFSNNILLTDNKLHVVYEISWNEIDKGNVIWQHGSFGTETYNLSYPTAAIYDSENRSIIWIADSGNKRIKKIDRSVFIDDISIYDYFVKDGINVGFNPISRMFSNKDELVLIEQTPEQEFFNTNINLHPALARAMDLKQGGISTKNNLNDYENLLFTPITKIAET